MDDLEAGAGRRDLEDRACAIDLPGLAELGRAVEQAIAGKHQATGGRQCIVRLQLVQRADVGAVQRGAVDDTAGDRSGRARDTVQGAVCALHKVADGVREAECDDRRNGGVRLGMAGNGEKAQRDERQC